MVDNVLNSPDSVVVQMGKKVKHDFMISDSLCYFCKDSG